MQKEKILKGHSYFGERMKRETTQSDRQSQSASEEVRGVG